MGIAKKLGNTANKLKGKGKEQAGRTARDPYLEAEGRRDQDKSDLKQAGEKIKNVFKR
jgi:uncharacterized protein YjbJ (UPF0337 family)